MQVQDKTVVRFDYTLTDPSGEVIDTSQGREPLAYLHGVGQIVPGLEREMVGKSEGDAFNVVVEPADGYGEHDPQMVQPVPRDRFEGVESIEPGMQFTAQTEAGPRAVLVTEVTEESVTVDANHPLAGVKLNFDVTIVEIRQATAEELDHGHAH